MRIRMQLMGFCLCLASAFPAAAQFTSFGERPSYAPAVSSPARVVGLDRTRAVDPIVFVDQVVDSGAREALLHLSVYADGWVSVSAARLRGSEVVSAEADFAEVGAETVRILQRELIAAGALRLSGSLPAPDAAADDADSFTQVTVFRPRSGRRQRLLAASSFRFGPSTQDPRVARVAGLIEAFVRQQFPGLDLP